MKHPFFLPAFGLAALMSVVVLSAAIAPALATTGAQFETVHSRNERRDGGAVHIGGIARRPAVITGAGPALALAAARDNRIGAPDVRLELHLDPTHWTTGRAVQIRLRDGR